MESNRENTIHNGKMYMTNVHKYNSDNSVSEQICSEVEKTQKKTNF